MTNTGSAVLLHPLLSCYSALGMAMNDPLSTGMSGEVNEFEKSELV